MKSYTHFTLDERICLQKLFSEGLSMRKIASILGRSPSTISRELNATGAKRKSIIMPGEQTSSTSAEEKTVTERIVC